MGYNKSKKENKKNNSLTNKIKTGWYSRYPVLIFALGFIVLISVFYLFWFSDWYSNHVNDKLASLNANIASVMLNLLNYGTSVSGPVIYSSVYSISIAKGCDGIEAMAVFSAALLSFPIFLRYKISGLFLGISILFVINVIRIICLFLIGIYYPDLFETMHAEVWPAIFIITAVGLWGMIIYKSPSKISLKQN